MAHIFAFEKLEVWKESRKLASDIYKLTQKYPDSEKYGLVSQMRRASISVCSNIAEGSSRTTAKDQANFYQMSYSGLMELLNQLIISIDLGFIEKDTLTTSRTEIEKIADMLNALMKSRLTHP